MIFNKLVKTRRMTRHFKQAPIDIELVKKALELSYYAPSAGNANGVSYAILTNPLKRQRFWEITSDPNWLKEPKNQDLQAAPVIIIVYLDPYAYQTRYGEPDKKGSVFFNKNLSNWPVPYWYIDAGAALMITLLSLHDSGLQALFFAIRNNAEKLAFNLNIKTLSKTSYPIGAIAVGKSLEKKSKSTKPKKRANIIVLD